MNDEASARQDNVWTNFCAVMLWHHTPMPPRSIFRLRTKKSLARLFFGSVLAAGAERYRHFGGYRHSNAVLSLSMYELLYVSLVTNAPSRLVGFAVDRIKFHSWMPSM